MFFSHFFLHYIVFILIHTQLIDGSTENRWDPKCNFTVFNPTTILNPYKQDVENYVPSRPFSSVYLKCMACLAIANEMDNVFKDVVPHEKTSKHVTIAEKLKQQIQCLCFNGFEKYTARFRLVLSLSFSYDLRKQNRCQFITDKFRDTVHVRSNMDGKWTEKLRGLCMSYINSMDFFYLLNEYLKQQENLSRYLCGSGGIFRDCIGVNYQNTTATQEDKQDKANICN